MGKFIKSASNTWEELYLVGSHEVVRLVVRQIWNLVRLYLVLLGSLSGSPVGFCFLSHFCNDKEKLDNFGQIMLVLLEKIYKITAWLKYLHTWIAAH